jgi:hypothetical protein
MREGREGRKGRGWSSNKFIVFFLKKYEGIYISWQRQK